MRIVPASPAHIRRIANRMREIDAIECRAHGREPVDALRYSLRSSLEAWTAFTDNGPQAMFGICPVDLIGRRGSPWFLGTDAVREHPRMLLTLGRETLNRWREQFDLMENEVAVDNALAIRLLNKWGAGWGGETVYRGTTFRRFKLTPLPPSA